MRLLSAGAACVACVFAQVAFAQADYFPLHVGNQWIYRSGGLRVADPVVMEITESREFDGQLYYLLRGFPLTRSSAVHWLRMDENGSLVAYDLEQKRERPWYLFGAPLSQSYESGVPSCCGRALNESRQARYRGPVGDFDTALAVTFPGVFQVGIVRDLFLPWVGLVHRMENTGGPTMATFDLIYARIGGVTVISQPEVAFSLSLDRASYGFDALALARLTLRNTGGQPLRLVFGSGQTYEITIADDAGKVVYRWSDGKAFTLALRAEDFVGERNWAVPARLRDSGSRPLAAGVYIATAHLTTQGGAAWSASVRFTITAP